MFSSASPSASILAGAHGDNSLLVIGSVGSMMSLIMAESPGSTPPFSTFVLATGNSAAVVDGNASGVFSTITSLLLIVVLSTGVTVSHFVLVIVLVDDLLFFLFLSFARLLGGGGPSVLPSTVGAPQ